MSKRKQVRARLRFQVFERDNYTCQYCGASAPKAVLHVDHICPVGSGGTNDIENLITACMNCNLGKAAHDVEPSVSDPLNMRLGPVIESIIGLRSANVTDFTLRACAAQCETFSEWVEVMQKFNAGDQSYEFQEFVRHALIEMTSFLDEYEAYAAMQEEVS